MSNFGISKTTSQPKPTMLSQKTNYAPNTKRTHTIIQLRNIGSKRESAHRAMDYEHPKQYLQFGLAQGILCTPSIKALTKDARSFKPKGQKCNVEEQAGDRLPSFDRYPKHYKFDKLKPLCFADRC